MTTLVRKLPKTDSREMRFAPSSLDDEARTVEAVIATATPVKRWHGKEVLVVREGAIDTTRLKGMPVLDSHNRSTVMAVLGKVESYQIANNRLSVKFRFADSERGRAAFDLVKDGMLTKVSVGYSVDDFEEVREDGGTFRVNVTRWTPYECSLVGVPADSNAKLRGAHMPAKAKKHVVEDDELETIENDDEINDDEIRSAPLSSVRQMSFIRRQLDDAGIPEVDVNVAMRGVTSIERARSVAIELLAEKSRHAPTDPILSSNQGWDDHRFINRPPRQNAIRENVADAWAVRLGAAPREKVQNPLIGAPTGVLVRTLLEAEGNKTRGLGDEQLIDNCFFGSTRAFAPHTTSDFPSLFLDAANRALIDRFAANLSVLKKFALKRNRKDFRASSFIRPGGYPALLPVLESGEIKYGTFEIESQSFAVSSAARAIMISRQMLINDDLGVFADSIAMQANSAANYEGEQLFALLSANSFGGVKLSDGKNFFHADHNNLATSGSELSVESISAARQAMRLQKNVNGDGAAGTVPAVIVVGPKKETKAEQVVAEIRASAIADVNPFAGKLRIEVEDRYDGNGWWLFADPQTRPAFIYGYLEGFEGPRFRSDEPFGVQGMAFSCELDFGCGPYDYRAAYRNPGVA